MINSWIWSIFHVPATVLDAEDIAANTIDKIPALMKLLFGGWVENKQCMKVISPMEKNNDW